MNQIETTPVRILENHIVPVLSDKAFLIGDIAGQYNALEDLLAIAPKDAFPVSLGDMVDRGPDSDKVLKFFMKNGQAIPGNHEIMMAEWLEWKFGYLTYEPYGSATDNMFHSPQDWTNNGGLRTLRSYGYESNFYEKTVRHDDLKEALTFIRSLPYAIKGDGWFASHAPPTHELLQPKNRREQYLGTWSRHLTAVPEENEFFFGHNSHWGFKTFEVKTEDGTRTAYGTCLDTSRQDILTGIYMPTREIFQVPYR